MKLAFTGFNEHEGLIRLKKAPFIDAIKNNENEEFWICRLLSTTNVFVGYFCMFATEGNKREYILNNDKGTVRIFKTLESAVSFYSDVRLSGGDCILAVNLGLV